MRATISKIVGVAIALLALGSMAMIGVRGQQTAGRPTFSGVATNWVGYLVVGGYVGTGPIAPFDPMPGTTGPLPRTVRQVQIGLRSDGAVIWREVTKPQ